MKCKHCKATIPDDAVFCEECGKPVGSSGGDGAGPVDQVTPMSGLITPDPDNPTGRDTRANPTLEPGQVFAGRYMIEAVIGRGGMGVVYKAIDKVSGQPVALKLISSSYLGGERAVRRLIEEGVTARDIRHPNVVAVYDVGLEGEQPFVAMEFVDGVSLRGWHGRLMQRGESVPLRVAARIICEVLDGLKAAHDKGVIHRDLKPENIILTGEPTDKSAALKLLDFGIARAAGRGSTSSSGTGGIGTPDYMAPEQRTNPDAAGPSADLYSISIMLYELLVGVVPGRHWQPPSGGRSDVPQEVDKLILRGMSDNRDLRPQSAPQYRQELVAAVNRIPLPGPDGPKNPSGGTGKVIAWIAGGGTALVLLIAAVAAVAGGGSTPDIPREPDYPRQDEEDPPVYVPDPEPAPKPAPVRREPTFAEYYSGTWQDGYGGSYGVRMSGNGNFTGSGQTLDGYSINWRGNLSNGVLAYTLSLNGQDFATGGGTLVDKCHINFTTYDGYGNVNLTGQFHVNHTPGQSCP